MKYLTIRLMKADIKQHIVKGKNYSRVEKQGEKPTFSNYSFVEIKGSIPDLFPDHDFIELREKDEPHYIDKIKIYITTITDRSNLTNSNVIIEYTKTTDA